MTQPIHTRKLRRPCVCERPSCNATAEYEVKRGRGVNITRCTSSGIDSDVWQGRTCTNALGKTHVQQQTRLPANPSMVRLPCMSMNPSPSFDRSLSLSSCRPINMLVSHSLPTCSTTNPSINQSLDLHVSLDHSTGPLLQPRYPQSRMQEDDRRALPSHVKSAPGGSEAEEDRHNPATEEPARDAAPDDTPQNMS